MAKTAQDLIRSRAKRQVLMEKYHGEMPCSVWAVDFSVDGGIQKFGKTQVDIATEKYNALCVSGRVDPNLRAAFDCSGKTVRGDKKGISVFPYNILERVVNFYTEPGDVVLDPCAGHNSRMQGVWQLGRSYIGYDVCHEFMEFNRAVAGKIQKKDKAAFFQRGGASITLHEQSSEKMVEDDNSVDFVFTSPPYWDLEYYSDHPDQLGRNHTYEEFLVGIGRVAAESLRVLKPGRFCVFNVNDFRKGGKFYMYHADLATRFVSVGFDAHDVIVMAWSTLPFRSIFASQVEQSKMTGKAHEYLMVFKKPE